MRDVAKVPLEYQNRLCGWSGSDTGSIVYGGEVPVKRLYQEISKLKYPYLDKSIKELKKKNKL